MRKKGLLTERQLEVLRLRLEGFTQQEVAELLKTSRENVAMLERRARGNLRRALETIEAILELTSTAAVELREGICLEDAASAILGVADESGVKLRRTFSEIVEELKRASASRGESLEAGLTVYITRDGDLEVLSAKLSGLLRRRRRSTRRLS